MTRLVPNRPDVLDEVFDGEAVLVNLRTGRYFALSASATEVWSALGQGTDWAELTAAVSVEDDPLVRFAHRLADEALVRVEGELPAAPDTDSFADGSADGGLDMDVFTDMQDLLQLDPIHDVNLDGSGWPESA